MEQADEEFGQTLDQLDALMGNQGEGFEAPPAAQGVQEVQPAPPVPERRGKGVMRYMVPRTQEKKKDEKKKPGQLAAQEVKTQQRRTDVLFTLSSFSRMMRAEAAELAQAPGTATDKGNYRITQGAIRVCMEACQDDVIKRLQASAHAARHAKRKTVGAEDLKVVSQITKMEISNLD